MGIALLGEAPISSQIMEKRSFSSLRSLTEMDSVAAAMAMATPYNIVLLCIPVLKQKSAPSRVILNRPASSPQSEGRHASPRFILESGESAANNLLEPGESNHTALNASPYRSKGPLATDFRSAPQKKIKTELGPSRSSLLGIGKQGSFCLRR